ncbi:MAG: hypothetical protein ACM3PY_03635, partial [Omnitrophica WOR_2 bacterium]
ARIRIGQQGSTTDWSRIAEMDRWSREKALREPGAYQKLARTVADNYWCGRVSRAFLASMLWNLRRGHLFTAVSRSTAAFAITNVHALYPAYWSGLATKIK